MQALIVFLKVMNIINSQINWIETYSYRNIKVVFEMFKRVNYMNIVLNSDKIFLCNL